MPTDVTASAILQLDPVPQLLARTQAELSGAFDFSQPLRASRAPGRLDVMGGIAEYTGSLVIEATLDRAAAVVLQERGDRELQIFSFNLFDEHLPFTFRMSIDALAGSSPEALRREFAQPGRQWAAYLAGCIFILHQHQFIDLHDPKIAGINLALLTTVPPGAGVASSAAVELATMMNLIDHFALREQSPETSRGKAITNGLEVARLCQLAENQIAGVPCGIMDQVACCLGRSGSLLRMVCQPHELQRPLSLPPGIRVIGINSNVKRSIDGLAYRRTRCAAFMGHKIILETMRQLGAAGGHELIADPMGGCLANLDPDDYKTLFRPRMPASIRGSEFLDRYGTINATGIDSAVSIDRATDYAVQHATDHHVLEARRVKRFAEFIEQAAAVPSPTRRGSMLDRAGHLMYASHQSYSMDAMLGADECDLLVALVRRRERAGLYGARITGRGEGGTVVVLADASDQADAALEEIAADYEKQTSRHPEILRGSSDGAWYTSTWHGRPAHV
jgi:L-arabinokinase